MFGLALAIALVSFRRDVVQGLARMRIGTKSIWIVVQAGWSLVSPLEGLDQHHLSLGCEVRLLRHPALPLVHQLLLILWSEAP